MLICNFKKYRSWHLLVQSNSGNTRTMCEIYSNLIIKTPERRYWHRSGVFIVNFEPISYIALLFSVLTLNK